MNRTTPLTRFLLVLISGLTPSLSHADVTLPSIFSDNMVLQRELDLPIWGTAGSGEKVTVKFAGQSKRTKADSDGKWMVRL